MKDGRNKQAADALAAMTGGQNPASSEPESATDEETSADASEVNPNVLGRVRHFGPSPLDRSIRAKRTMIPILLTLGFLLPVVAALKWLMPLDSPFAAWPPAAVFASISLGAV